ncbi:MAG: c-type cytochrome [Pseudomonadales bacterium]|nr:c-type cytochrome [Pseudomonadales bacterium]
MEIRFMSLHFLTSSKKLFALTVFSCSLLIAPNVFGQSLQDGVYTDSQAERGAEEYASRCASCHSADLRGNSNSPSLIGLSFMFIWEGKSLGELFTKMSNEMPTEDPGSLSKQSYAAILAYILKSNEFPAGDIELASNANALEEILISSQ